MFRADYEAFWGWADVAEGIAGHQRDNIFGGIAEDAGVFRLDDGDQVNAIEEGTGESGERDFVAFVNVAEFAEESVSMRGEADVTGVANGSGAGDVADSALQGARAGALLNHGA